MEKGSIINDCDAASKVWTREGNVFTAHAVEIGLSDGIYTEITGGLAEGTEVVTEARIVDSKKENAKAGMSFMPGPPR